jgi:hypothetical protein
VRCCGRFADRRVGWARRWSQPGRRAEAERRAAGSRGMGGCARRGRVGATWARAGRAGEQGQGARGVVLDGAARLTGGNLGAGRAAR